MGERLWGVPYDTSIRDDVRCARYRDSLLSMQRLVFHDEIMVRLFSGSGGVLMVLLALQAFAQLQQHLPLFRVNGVEAFGHDSAGSFEAIHRLQRLPHLALRKEVGSKN